MRDQTTHRRRRSVRTHTELLLLYLREGEEEQEEEKVVKRSERWGEEGEVVEKRGAGINDSAINDKNGTSNWVG